MKFRFSQLLTFAFRRAISKHGDLPDLGPENGHPKTSPFFFFNVFCFVIVLSIVLSMLVPDAMAEPMGFFCRCSPPVRKRTSMFSGPGRRPGDAANHTDRPGPRTAGDGLLKFLKGLRLSKQFLKVLPLGPQMVNMVIYGDLFSLLGFLRGYFGAQGAPNNPIKLPMYHKNKSARFQIWLNPFWTST